MRRCPDLARHVVAGPTDEDTVDFRPNYDGSLQEPVVLPGAFPNLLANEMLVPELIQQDATVENLSSAVIASLDSSARDQLKARFDQLRNQINRDSGNCAAAEIAKLIGLPDSSKLPDSPESKEAVAE